MSSKHAREPDHGQRKRGLFALRDPRGLDLRGVRGKSRDCTRHLRRGVPEPPGKEETHGLRCSLSLCPREVVALLTVREN